MIKAVFLVCAIWLGLAGPVLAEASFPPVKPLADSPTQPFTPGLDVPPANPARPAQQKPASPGKIEDTTAGEKPNNTTAGACVLANANFEAVDAIEGEDGCGIAAPVRLISVKSGANMLAFSQEPFLNCKSARVVADWLTEDVVRLSRSLLGSPVVRLENGPGYVCRRRNNQPDGKLSEHARGNALDITAFQTADGETVSIERGWGTDTPKGRFLAEVHASACERFATVLGPDADPHHKSHFHLDNRCRGQACTYKICQ